MRVWRNTVVRFGMLAVPVGISPLVGKGAEGHLYDAETRERVRQTFVRPDGTACESTVTLYDVPDAEPIEVSAAIRGAVGVDLEGCVPIGTVDPSLYDSAYVLTPAKDAPSALATLAAVLRDSGSVLVGRARFTESTSAKSVVLRWSPLVGGIVLHTLHALDRVRIEEAKSVTASLPIPALAEYTQGEAFVAALPDAFSPIATDDRDAAIRAAVLAAKGTEESTEEETKSPADYLEALRASVDAIAAERKSEAIEA